MDTRCDSTAVIGYVRVSSQDQADGGISLDAQRHRLEAYCAAHDLVLARVEEDAGISARKTTNRPALQRALQALKSGEASGLVAVKLDRLSRTTRDVLDLVARAEKESWALHSIEERLDTSSPQGRFVVTILGAIAQLEREQAAERTRAAMAELRRQGKRTSRFPPFGHRFQGDRVVEEPAEQPVLQRMLELQAEGSGCYRIASVLNREGNVNPRTGKPWFYGTVRDILVTAGRRARG
ncbi:MAG: recombinase family protein [Planctomycetota bacterium]|jgi:DNA invertase Pin-like site-specific DNA recombinase